MCACVWSATKKSHMAKPFQSKDFLFALIPEWTCHMFWGVEANNLSMTKTVQHRQPGYQQYRCELCVCVCLHAPCLCFVFSVIDCSFLRLFLWPYFGWKKNWKKNNLNAEDEWILRNEPCRPAFYPGLASVRAVQLTHTFWSSVVTKRGQSVKHKKLWMAWV